MAKVENDYTQTNYECEILRTDLLKKRTALGELEQKLKAEEALVVTQGAQIKYSERILDKKNAEIQALTTKLQKLNAEQEVKFHTLAHAHESQSQLTLSLAPFQNLGIGRLEEEVQELEKQVLANRSVCVDLQERWLKLQDELVTLTAKRDQILAENDLRRKGEEEEAWSDVRHFTTDPYFSRGIHPGEEACASPVRERRQAPRDPDTGEINQECPNGNQSAQFQTLRREGGAGGHGEGESPPPE